jgi:hypothetical protein
VSVILAALLLASACGGESVRFEAPSQSPTAAATPIPTATTFDPAAACTNCWPLSGKPLSDAGAATRRPLVVKIDNVPAARPHYGITQADLVVEELVEGFVTRLAAFYHSQDPQTLGGVRSARLADLSLSTMVRGALVYSGTSAHAARLIGEDAASGKYIDLSADRSPGYYRVSFRASPYNLFTSAVTQRETLAKQGKATVGDVPKLAFLADAAHTATIGGMVGAAAAGELVIPYRDDSSKVTYKYDAATKTYARWQNAQGSAVRTVDAATNSNVAAVNVVIIHTEIWEVDEIVDASGAKAHDMRLTGTGAASIFRNGLRQDGTWSRKDDVSPFVFTNRQGEQIKLSPGQTWISIIPNDWVVASS